MLSVKFFKLGILKNNVVVTDDMSVRLEETESRCIVRIRNEKFDGNRVFKELNIMSTDKIDYDGDVREDLTFVKTSNIVQYTTNNEGERYRVEDLMVEFRKKEVEVNG